MSPTQSTQSARALPTAAAIETAAARLNTLREAWLYPHDLITEQPEVVEGLPMRRLAKNDTARQQLARRTMTALYNDRPGWLVEAHRELDAAVAAAYGWPDDVTDDDALHRLLAMNLQRSA